LELQQWVGRKRGQSSHGVGIATVYLKMKKYWFNIRKQSTSNVSFVI